MTQHSTGPFQQTNRWALLAVLVSAPAAAHMKGMFKTKQEAEKRAAELKCKGAFAMGSLWMPCANMQDLHKAMDKE
jgi:hypothetical protein